MAAMLGVVVVVPAAAKVLLALLVGQWVRPPNWGPRGQEGAGQPLWHVLGYGILSSAAALLES